MVETGLQLISNSVKDPSVISMIAGWLKQYNNLQLRERRRHRLIAAIGDGYDTYGELSVHTGISYATVRRELTKLVRLKKITQTLVKVRGIRCGGFEYRFTLAL